MNLLSELVNGTLPSHHLLVTIDVSLYGVILTLHQLEFKATHAGRALRQMCILMFYHRENSFSDRCMANYPVTFNNSENCEQLSDMDKDLIYICVNAIAFFSSSFFPFFFCRFLQIVLHI